jgi:hypothetical protein
VVLGRRGTGEGESGHQADDNAMDHEFLRTS